MPGNSLVARNSESLVWVNTSGKTSHAAFLSQNAPSILTDDGIRMIQVRWSASEKLEFVPEESLERDSTKTRRMEKCPSYFKPEEPVRTAAKKRSQEISPSLWYRRTEVTTSKPLEIVKPFKSSKIVSIVAPSDANPSPPEPTSGRPVRRNVRQSKVSRTRKHTEPRVRGRPGRAKRCRSDGQRIGGWTLDQLDLVRQLKGNTVAFISKISDERSAP